jgi:hypothetical protein
MADDDTPKRKRSMKPKAGVIDLEATEIERGPIQEAPAAEEPVEGPPAEGPDPLAEEPPHEADDPELFEAEPRSPLGALIAAGTAGAAISILAFLLLLAAGLIPIGGRDAALDSRIAGLEAQLDRAAKAPPPAAAAPAEDPKLRGEVEALKQEIEKLRLSPVPAQGADPAVDSRLSELSGRVDALSAAAATTSLEAVEQLKARIDEVAAQASAARAPDPAAQEALASARGAAAMSAFAVLENAVSRGVPYADALAALRRLLPDASFAGLENDAEKGLAPAALLARRYAEKLEAAPPPDSTQSGLVDRLAEGARGLVRIRPAAGTPEAFEIKPGDPWSARMVIGARLDAGDYADAVAASDQLDPIARTATAGEASLLAARLDADAALDRLRKEAFAQAEGKL